MVQDAKCRRRQIVGAEIRAAKTTERPRRSAAVRPERGANAQRIEEILKSAAPRALRQEEIRKALQEKGSELTFTSIRHARAQ